MRSARPRSVPGSLTVPGPIVSSVKRTAAWSSVSGQSRTASPANATTPTRLPCSRSSSASASRRDSSIRDGGTSRVCMLAETSITNAMSEPCDWRRTASRPHCGPAAPAPSNATAASRSPSRPIRRPG